MQRYVILTYVAAIRNVRTAADVHACAHVRNGGVSLAGVLLAEEKETLTARRSIGRDCVDNSSMFPRYYTVIQIVTAYYHTTIQVVTT